MQYYCVCVHVRARVHIMCFVPDFAGFPLAPFPFLATLIPADLVRWSASEMAEVRFSALSVSIWHASKSEASSETMIYL